MTCSQLLEGLQSESKYKTTEGGRLGARSLAHNILRGRGACWSSGMGLGGVDKLHSLTWACTQPTQGGQCIVGALLVLRRATGNTDTQDSPWPGLVGSHHLPPNSISASLHGAYIQIAFLSQDSCLGVPNSRYSGLLQLWSPITLRADLVSRCSLKQSCSSRRELSNSMSHVVCT